MTWFAAHVIMAVKLKNKEQTKFPVWENIILVEAGSNTEAFAKAEGYARRDEGDDDGTFRWAGQPATWVFAGVRRLTECVVAGERPGDGDELSFNELELASKEEVERLARGGPVTAKHVDRYPAATKKPQQRSTKRADRKRA